MEIQSLKTAAAKLNEAATNLKSVDPRNPSIGQVVVNMKAAGEALASAAAQLQGAEAEIVGIIQDLQERANSPA